MSHITRTIGSQHKQQHKSGYLRYQGKKRKCRKMDEPVAVIYKTKDPISNYISAPNTLRDKSSWNNTYLGNKVSLHS